MSSDDFELNQNNNGKVSVKKSTFNGLIIGLIVAVGVTAFIAGTYTSNLNSNQISEEDLEEAIAKLELKLLQNQLPTEQPKLVMKISADNDPVIGNPDAPITIIEFSDFQCPFCARFYTQTLPLIYEEYIDQGKVKLVFRDYPIQSIHPNAVPASVASECANEQGKFKEMHDILFDNQNQWSGQETGDALSLFSQYATEIQLEQETFDSCLTSGKYIEEIQKDLGDGQKYGVTGTPGFFIGNDQIGYVELKGAQPFDSFKKVIDAQLDA
jgi:protein-disulfide isomerase